jgi:hypothetical protein
MLLRVHRRTGISLFLNVRNGCRIVSEVGFVFVVLFRFHVFPLIYPVAKLLKHAFLLLKTAPTSGFHLF